MTELSKAKWFIASCGLICLATFLALSLRIAGKPASRVGEVSQVSRIFRDGSVTRVRSASAGNSNVIKRYAQLPLAFEASVSREAKFLARGKGYALFLANHEAVLELRGRSKTPVVVRMDLAGANPDPAFAAFEELPGKSNYFIGNDHKKWRINVLQYRKVLEQNVYDGVNLVYYGTQGQLEYDFDVSPGINPSVIRLAFKGADRLQIDAQGELIVHTAGGEVRLRTPVAYQESAGSKEPVEVAYRLRDKDSVEFLVAKYDSGRPLVIDPILIYSSYLGGSNIDSSNSIAVAPDNTAFIAGATFSSNFPTAHPLQADAGGNPDFPADAFVSKISADGSMLLYSTYLGGMNRDAANGIAVDSFGNAFVTGTTLSPDYPVSTGSFNTECGGDGKCGATFDNGLLVTNAFVTELNPAGSAIVYSGFIGENENVDGLAIAVDSNDNAYVTGSTSANIPTTVVPGPPPFPITAGAFQKTFGGGSTNAFVVKIGATGSAILYSSYLGGEIEDVGYGIAVDRNANAYVTGLTYSTKFPPSTTVALQATYGGAGDAFVAEVNTTINTTAAAATSLVYSTYLGGTGLDQGNAIALDSAGNIYVAGLTNSATFGFTPAATVVQPTFKGQGDAFVAELTNAGALSYFTYLGGTHADSATGIAVDSTGNVYITGTTASTDFPTAGAVFQPAYGGGNTDSFVAKIGPAGTPLVYASYLGGTNAELATGIAVDTSGSAYVTGQTCSDDFPLANPFQAVPGGNCDAYIAKVSILAGIALNPAGLIFPAQSLNTTSQSQTITLTNGDNAQTISSIVISGTNATDFADTTTCGSSLIVGATCTVTVTFTPTASGVRKATLVITDSAPGSPQELNLTGNTSTVTLSASTLSFGSEQVGVPSSSQAVTVTNSGTTPLTFSSISASGDFSETDNCTKAPLQPTTNCVINVTFTPSAAVASIGAITLTDSGSGSPQEILVTGTGILEPQAVLSPLSLGFSSQSIGATSAPQLVTLSNTGDSSLNISSITVTGDFSQTNTCGSILAANSNCSIGVIFTPSAAGNRTGILTVTDNAANVPGSSQTVVLLGVGQAVPVASLSQTTLTFAAQALQSTSAVQAVTLTNTGSAALVISSVTSSGDFAQINNCPTSVAAGNGCTINVTFTPKASGNRFGTITITDNATNSPQTITTSGTGGQATFQIASLTPAVTVPAGQMATYGLSVYSNAGFSQAVALSCSGLPAAATCSFSPTAVTPTAAESTTPTVMLTVATGLRTLAPPSSRIKMNPFDSLRHFGGAGIVWLVVALMILTIAVVRRRPVTAGFGFAVILLLISAACGGGGVAGTPSGTPAGSYQVTVTGTSGSVTNSTQVTLLVN